MSGSDKQTFVGGSERHAPKNVCEGRLGEIPNTM